MCVYLYISVYIYMCTNTFLLMCIYTLWTSPFSRSHRSTRPLTQTHNLSHVYTALHHTGVWDPKSASTRIWHVWWSHSRWMVGNPRGAENANRTAVVCRKETRLWIPGVCVCERVYHFTTQTDPDSFCKYDAYCSISFSYVTYETMYVVVS